MKEEMKKSGRPMEPEKITTEKIYRFAKKDFEDAIGLKNVDSVEVLISQVIVHTLEIREREERIKENREEGNASSN